jgi:hypothetical protein
MGDFDDQFDDEALIRSDEELVLEAEMETVQRQHDMGCSMGL